MRVRTILGATVLAGSAVLLPTTPAVADRPSGSICPPNSELLIVEDLTEQGYLVPALVDEAGNNNGLVCGDPFTRLQQRIYCLRYGPCTVPVIYNFSDDRVIR